MLVLVFLTISWILINSKKNRGKKMFQVWYCSYTNIGVNMWVNFFAYFSDNLRMVCLLPGDCTDKRLGILLHPIFFFFFFQAWGKCSSEGYTDVTYIFDWHTKAKPIFSCLFLNILSHTLLDVHSILQWWFLLSLDLLGYQRVFSPVTIFVIYLHSIAVQNPPRKSVALNNNNILLLMHL